jgi:hypothetical protein
LSLQADFRLAENEAAEFGVVQQHAERVAERFAVKIVLPQRLELSSDGGTFGIEGNRLEI